MESSSLTILLCIVQVILLVINSVLLFLLTGMFKDYTDKQEEQLVNKKSLKKELDQEAKDLGLS